MEDRLKDLSNENNKLSQYELLFNIEKEKNISLMRQVKALDNNHYQESPPKNNVFYNKGIS